MKIKDLIPFNWRHHKDDAVSVPVTHYSPGMANPFAMLRDDFLRLLFQDEESEDVRSPALYVRERGDAIEIEAELPGIEPKDIDVRIENEHVVIYGHREESTEEGKQGRWRTESYQRVVPLPCGVRADEAKASYRHGVLTLRLPRAERPSHRVHVHAD